MSLRSAASPPGGEALTVLCWGSSRLSAIDIRGFVKELNIMYLRGFAYLKIPKFSSLSYVTH